MKQTLAAFLLLAACGGPVTTDEATATAELAAAPSCCGQPGCTLPCPAPAPAPDGGAPPACCPAGDVLVGNACCPACTVPAPGQVACALPCMLAAGVCPAPPPACTPTCTGKPCGADDGCGKPCGTPERICRPVRGRLRCVDQCGP